MKSMLKKNGFSIYLILETNIPQILKSRKL